MNQHLKSTIKRAFLRLLVAVRLAKPDQPVTFDQPADKGPDSALAVLQEEHPGMNARLQERLAAAMESLEGIKGRAGEKTFRDILAARALNDGRGGKFPGPASVPQAVEETQTAPSAPAPAREYVPDLPGRLIPIPVPAMAVISKKEIPEEEEGK